MIFCRAQPRTTRSLRPRIESLEGLAAHICSLVHTFAPKIAREDTGDGGNRVDRGGGRPPIAEATKSRISSSSLRPGLCAQHKFGLGVVLAVPDSHEHNFVAERVPEYVVDVGRAIDFKETRTAGVCPVQTSVEQKAQLCKLPRRVMAQIFNHSRQVCLFVFLRYFCQCRAPSGILPCSTASAAMSFRSK